MLPDDRARARELRADRQPHAAYARRCQCGEDVVVVNHRYGLHYDGADAARICPSSHTLTREGWKLLIRDALADEGLIVTDGRQGTSGSQQDKAAIRRFLDSFLVRWTRLLNNELPQFHFDPAQWSDLVRDPPSSDEINEPVQQIQHEHRGGSP